MSTPPDVEAFAGGLGLGLTVFFVALLLSVGVAVIRRFLD
jgi:hypothetical protein